MERNVYESPMSEVIKIEVEQPIFSSSFSRATINDIEVDS